MKTKILFLNFFSILCLLAPDVSKASVSSVTINCPSNIMVTATSSNGTVVFFSVTASGGCSTPSVTANPPSGSTFSIGTTTVNSTASDSCGNSNTCSFTVTVNPPTPINLTCSSNITVTASGPGGAVVFFTCSATGGCSPPPSVVANPPSGSTFPIGTTTVNVTASDTCGNSTNCSFTVMVNYTGNLQADLQVTKYGPPDPVVTGQNIDYIIYVYNSGPSTSTNVIVRDAIPAGTIYVSSTPTGTYYPNFQRVDISIGDLPAFTSTYVTVTVQVTNAEQIVNAANSYGDTPDPDTSNNVGWATNNAVNPQADLQVTKYGPADPVTVGQNMTYTIYVYNAGPSTSSNVIVRDAIPAGTIYVSSTPTGTYYPNFQRVDISIGDLPAFTSTYVTVTVQVTNAQQIVNAANANGTTPDPNTSNDVGWATNNAVNPQADLQVTKTIGTNSIFVGGTAPFTIAITNLGPDTASNITVTDVLPPGLAYNSAGVPGGTSFNQNNGTWTITSLAAGNGYALALSALATNAGTFTNTASLTSSTPTDTNAANNSASAVVTATVFLKPADLQVTKTASSTNAPTGSQVIFRLQLQNLGPNNVTNSIVVTDCLPPGYQYVTDCTVGGGGIGTYSPGTCQWTLPAGLSTNAIVNLFITTLAMTGGTYTNTATVAVPAGYTDPNTNNNTSSVVVVIYPVHTLSGYVRGCQTNGTPIPLVTVTLSGAAGATTVTDINGFFTFTNLIGGGYTVTPSQAGNTFAPASATLTLSSNMTLAAFVGSSSLIQGTVSYSTNGGGIGGVLVQLTGAQTHSALTDTNGYYIFPNLTPGSYTVTPVSTNGFIFTPTNAVFTLSGTNCTGLAKFTSSARTVLLVAMEVNQAIQDWSNSVPLVQDKETVLRAFLQLPNNTNPPVLIQGARLYATGPGGPLAGSPQPPMNSNGVYLVQTTNAAAGRSNFVNSLNFRLPPAWLSGTINLQLVCTNNVTVIPTNVVPANSTVRVTFAPVAAPQVKFFGIDWTNRTGAGQTISGANLRNMADRMRATYPVARVDALYSTLGPLSQNSLQGTNSMFGDGTTNSYPNLNKINSALVLLRALDSLFLPVGNRIYYGAIAGLDYVAQQRGRFTVGMATDIPGPAASGFSPANPYGAAGRINGLGRHTHSHEIGHDLGLQHDVSGAINGYSTYVRVNNRWMLTNTVALSTNSIGANGACGEIGATNSVYPLFQPLPNGALVPALGPLVLGSNALVFGLDTLTLDTTNLEPVLSPYQYFDLMSYCRGGLEDRWAGVFTYQTLLGTINGNFTAPPPPPPLGQLRRWLFIRGRLDAINDTAEFAPFVAVESAATPPSPPAGNYFLILRDANGNVLNMVSFAPEQGIDDDADDEPAEDQFLVPVPIDPISQPVPIQEVEVTDGINILADIVANTNLPSVSSVTLTATNGGSFTGSGILNINWIGFDADPNVQLTYTVQYSSAGGTNWQTLAADLSDPAYSLDSQYLKATTQGQIRVIASDGFNSSDPAYSAIFTVVNHAPVVTLTSPMDGALFTADQQIFLAATADDPQDGPLGGASVQWTSSLDGTLGTGDTLTLEADNLSEGRHDITVTARDSLGLTNSDTVTLFVLRQPPPQISIQMVGSQVLLSWPAGVTNYVLESSPSLSPPATWSAVTNTPVVVDIQQTVALDFASATSRFFRLHL